MKNPLDSGFDIVTTTTHKSLRGPRGMKEKEMIQIGNWMTDALKNYSDQKVIRKIKKDVEAFCLKYPVPGLD